MLQQVFKLLWQWSNIDCSHPDFSNIFGQMALLSTLSGGQMRLKVCYSSTHLTLLASELWSVSIITLEAEKGLTVHVAQQCTFSVCGFKRVTLNVMPVFCAYS